MKALALLLTTFIGTTQAVFAGPATFKVQHDPNQCPALSGEYSLSTNQQIKSSFDKDDQGNLVIHFDSGDSLHVTGVSQSTNNGGSQQAAGCVAGKIEIRVVHQDLPTSNGSLEASDSGFRILIQGMVVLKYIR